MARIFKKKKIFCGFPIFIGPTSVDMEREREKEWKMEETEKNKLEHEERGKEIERTRMTLSKPLNTQLAQSMGLAVSFYISTTEVYVCRL